MNTPTDTTPPPSEVRPPPRRRHHRVRKALLILGGAFTALILLIVVLSVATGSKKPAAAPTPKTSATTSAPATPTSSLTAAQQQFVTDMATKYSLGTGTSASNASVLVVGNDVCSMLKSGAPASSIAALVQSARSGMSASTAAGIVSLAGKDLCPQDVSAPTPTTATSAPATPASQAPTITASQQQALTSAQGYLSDGQGFSRAGLIAQLDSPDGGQFSVADATWAVDNSGANWNSQAVIAAKGYLSDGQGFSRQGLIDQLDSPDGGQFTYAQAVYGVDQAGL